MRIRFETQGGLAHFPGLNRPHVVDSEDLPTERAEELRRRIDATRFGGLPPQVGTPRAGAADYRSYTVTVEDGGHSHTVCFTDPIKDPSHQALFDYLKTL